MPTLRRIAPALVLSLAAVALPAGALAAPSIPSIPKVPKVKTRIAKVQIQLAGFVELRQLHDTVSDCFPGEHWIQSNRYEFDTGSARNIALKRVTGEGFPPIVTSPFTAPAGTSATVTGKISEYRTTNHCPPDAPGEVRPEPRCRSLNGRTQVSLQEAPPPELGDDDLAPLTSSPILLAIRRSGGGIDGGECAGGGAQSVTGADTATALVTTSIGPSVSAIVPAGISVLQLFRIRPGQHLTRSVLIAGPCTAVRITTSSAASATPADGALNADGDCWITGKVLFTIRPRPAR